MFAGWGRFVYRFRWATLVASGVLLAISVALLAMGGTLTSGGPLTSNLQAYKAGNLVTRLAELEPLLPAELSHAALTLTWRKPDREEGRLIAVCAWV